jgi:RND family efflux transporter MFP subunit
MQFLRRTLVGLFLISATVGTLAAAGHVLWSAMQDRLARETAPAPARERVTAVNTVAVTAGRVVPSFTAFGEVQSRRTLQVRSSASGRVVFLSESFEEGAAVSEGMLLAQIDTTDAEAEVEVARADIAEAEAALRDAERTLALARDELAAAEAQAGLRMQALDRQRSLEARGVGTTAAVEEAELVQAGAAQAVLTRRIAVSSAESRLDAATNALARARIALLNAERDLADTEIRAAFDGTLADVQVVAGGIVTQNEQIATLIDPDALEVAFQVSTMQYARLLDESARLIDAPVRITLDVLGLDLEAAGRITRVGASVDEGLTGRRLFADLDRVAGFRPGDFVSVHVEEPPLDAVARLPASAVGPDGAVLAVTAESRLEAAPVEVLRRQGDEVLVRAPALEGRRVVVERSPQVGPGIRIRDLSAERPPEVAAAGAPGAAPGGEAQIALTPERRAALIAAVEANSRMPAEAKARVLGQLRQEMVPAGMVARIESRSGG